jgi:hypothetical protein
VTVETIRPGGARQVFIMRDHGDYLESVAEIPEPHEFTANVRIGRDNYPVMFEEHEHAHGSADRDNNMRAAIIHVMADAAVSVLVIVGLLFARVYGSLWMDPLAGIVGACVIASPASRRVDVAGPGRRSARACSYRRSRPLRPTSRSPSLANSRLPTRSGRVVDLRPSDAQCRTCAVTYR